MCSNQAFLATLAGASLLAKGDHGLAESIQKARSAHNRIQGLLNKLDGISLAFPNSTSFNDLLLQIDRPVDELQKKASAKNLQIGVDVSNRMRTE